MENISFNENDEKIKYTAKDSVFINLFHIPKNALALVKSLCPEIDATENDIEFLTLNSVLMVKPYNDLGLLVKGNLLLLAEAQSTWSVNALVRMFMYLAETYHRYIEEREDFNIYGSKKLTLPKPACFIIYTGKEKNIPKILSLKKEFFDNNSILDLKAKIISAPGKGNIIKEYIRFCHVLNEMISVYGRTATAVEETIRICQNENVLKEYLEEHKKEVNTIMTTLFSQDEVNKRWANEIRAEGRLEGRLEGRSEGRTEGILFSLKNLMNTLGCTLDNAMDTLKVPMQERDIYKRAMVTGSLDV